MLLVDTVSGPAALVPFDPFKRTKSIPFAIAGRRRSTHVNLRPTIDDIDKQPEQPK